MRKRGESIGKSKRVYLAPFGFLFVGPRPSDKYWELLGTARPSHRNLGNYAMFTASGLALMLLDHAVVRGRPLPPGAVGTEDDFGDDLPQLMRHGLIFPFDPSQGLPPIPVDGKAPSYAYADFAASA
jgi:hypothetical protein